MMFNYKRDVMSVNLRGAAWAVLLSCTSTLRGWNVVGVVQCNALAVSYWLCAPFGAEECGGLAEMESECLFQSCLPIATAAYRPAVFCFPPSRGRVSH